MVLSLCHCSAETLTLTLASVVNVFPWPQLSAAFLEALYC